MMWIIQWLSRVSPSETAECLAISRPPPRYNATSLKGSLSGYHNNTHQFSLSPQCHHKVACLRDMNNEYADSLPMSPMSSHFKTIFHVELHWLKEPCLLGNLDNEHAVFPSVTNKWPFQDLLLSKTIISSEKAVSQQTWTMNM